MWEDENDYKKKKKKEESAEECRGLAWPRSAFSYSVWPEFFAGLVRVNGRTLGEQFGKLCFREKEGARKKRRQLRKS